MFLNLESLTLAGLVGLVFFVAGAIHAVDALMQVRSSRASIAWILALLTIPIVALPIYWLVGRNRLKGYVAHRRSGNVEQDEPRQALFRYLDEWETEVVEERRSLLNAASIMAQQKVTGHNRAELFINGKDAFASMFEALEQAREEILVSYYVIKHDRLGMRFQAALIDRARAGVRVLVLVDAFGSHALPRRAIRRMQDGGVEVAIFGKKRKLKRFQMNFRNHRKIVVVDGKWGYTGGLNVGDDYIGEGKRFGHWRDTHLRIEGPAVAGLKLAFFEDWNWATGNFPELGPLPEPVAGGAPCLILASGPADRLPTWQLFVIDAAANAHKRLWISSPYFVPDSGVLAALQGAAVRGVDVRILLPSRPDHYLVWLACYTYYEDALPFGVKLYRYEKGFLHSKSLLVDDDIGYVGSANLDNRSLFLNFEIGAVGCRKEDIEGLIEMLEADFELAREVTLEEFSERAFGFRVLCQAARLFSPVL